MFSFHSYATSYFILLMHDWGKVKIVTHPTTFKPFFTREGSVGLLPETSSSNKTPKLYTSDFSVATPLWRYSARSCRFGRKEMSTNGRQQSLKILKLQSQELFSVDDLMESIV